MIFGILLLLTGLTISAVAIYYSVLGLASIFAAATIPIYIMGGTLEVAKLVAASWLKANWNRVTGFIKWYMVGAVAILMLITSMGIFGFLSKAHLDQSVPTGDVAAQVALIEEKIKTQRDNIESSRAALTQMDAQVNQRLTGKNADQSAERSVQIRRAQARERATLQNEIAAAQKEIARLNEERAPIASQLRKVEAEVGPIKYIAQFVYGQAADQNLLEKAVTWVIILIVVVFDPLAIAMLLAAQMTFAWYKKDKEQSNAYISTNDVVVDDNSQRIDTGFSEPNPVVSTTVEESKDAGLTGYDEAEIKSVEEVASAAEEGKFDFGKHPYLFNNGFWDKPEGWASVGPVVYTPEPSVELPTADTTEITVDEPKYQILPELVEESSKKKIYDQAAGTTGDKDQEIAYVQNSEQSENSLWNRVRSRVSEEFKPKDFLIVVYAQGNFEDFQYDPETEPELDKFIQDIKNNTHSFGDYPHEQLKLFASRIYELRKN